jgi:hypothetical protein
MGYVWCPPPFPLIPVVVFSSRVDDLHLDHEHVLSNPVLETIDYLVRLSNPTVLEHVALKLNTIQFSRFLPRNMRFYPLISNN